VTARKKIRIGELLVQHGIISEEQLTSALAEQKRTGSKLGHTLVELGYLSPTGFLKFLGQQLQIPYIDLRHYQYKAETVRLLPEIYARRFRSLVLAEERDGLLVGMADPTDIFSFDELRRILKRPVKLAVVGEDELLDIVDRIYRRTDEIIHIAGELSEELGEGGIDLESLLSGSDIEDAPVVRLLHTLFEDAVQIGASDIHIEPDESVLRIRQRIDGVLHEQVMKEKRIGGALVSRLKLMSGLDISERRLPQDGRFNIRVRGRSIDIRLSTMPLQFGESVVMRLLDQSGGLLSLDQIGMPDPVLRRFRNLIQRPHGLVLVTGPTGSGKTTTLYGALNALNDATKKIITVEDPVEYRLPRINQVQVQGRIDLSFARVLRAALRQDPDVVMVGEMRDQETAQIGLRAAMTGHLVLSTLHTNDAVSTALRLLDMGAEGFVVGSSLLAILAQRLVRRVCESCAEDDTPDAGQRSWLAAMVGPQAQQQVFKRGAGCPRCHNTGYYGRIGIFELLQIDTALADALRRNDSAGFAQLARRQPGFKNLSMAAYDYACQGVTSMEEVLRVSGQIEDVDLITGQPTVNEDEAHAAVQVPGS
jgi:MSHA biogenesis protein MshE